MCAIASGISLSKLRPFASSFFIFTDYCRGALRLSAMMELPVIYIWTHDSISMGEDGPTHQPIEQLASFRAMPGMIVLRPADANEVVEAWRLIMEIKDRPVSLVLTRQPLATLDRTKYAPASGVSRGAYVLADVPDHRPAVLLLATGSEVSLCITAHEQLKSEGINARVISMPSWELFESRRVRVSQQRPPAGDSGARRRRRGIHFRLGTLYRLRWNYPGSAYLRIVRAADRSSRNTSASSRHTLSRQPGNKSRVMPRRNEFPYELRRVRSKKAGGCITESSAQCGHRPRPDHLAR